MKKLTILVTALCLTALTACSTNQANSSQSAQPSQSAQTSQPAEPAQSTAPATEAKSIKPTPVANIDLEHPQEGFNAPVSFAAADVKKGRGQDHPDHEGLRTGAVRRGGSEPTQGR